MGSKQAVRSKGRCDKSHPRRSKGLGLRGPCRGSAERNDRSPSTRSLSDRSSARWPTCSVYTGGAYEWPATCLRARCCPCYAIHDHRCNTNRGMLRGISTEGARATLPFQIDQVADAFTTWSRAMVICCNGLRAGAVRTVPSRSNREP